MKNETELLIYVLIFTKAIVTFQSIIQKELGTESWEFFHLIGTIGICDNIIAEYLYRI